MSLSKKENTLEREVAEDLKFCDKYSRVTRGSGSGTEILDVLHEEFFVSCKDRGTSKNVNLDYNREVLKDNAEVPFYSDKELFWVVRNSLNDKFAIIDWNAFLRILKLAYGEQDVN